MFEKWETIGRPGYLGGKKDETYTRWNQEYGVGNWRISWQLANGQDVDYEYIFHQIYVTGYEQFFRQNIRDLFFVMNYAFTYDKDKITRQQAFDPYALVNKPGVANQFHHVALNLAVRDKLGVSFLGTEPLKVREGKPGTPLELQPLGYKFSPGRIPCTRPELIPTPQTKDSWWGDGSIEQLYQEAKALQIKR
jgi:hypothetical protein